MAYQKRDIKDRIAAGDDKFKAKVLSGSLLTGEANIQLIPTPDSVIEEGTVVNRALMQPWEDSIADLKD